jgi:flagellar protein FlaG
MDVTTNYNSANIAVIQQPERPGRPLSGAAVTERPTTLRQTERPSDTRISQNTPADANAASRTSLREESVTDIMLERAFEDANRALAGGSFSLSYRIHEGSSRIMVTVHEAQSRDVLREIPMESRLEIYARITEFVGLLFDRGN